MANRIHCSGFTLLEVMLVMVLLGLAFSAVVPSLPAGDGGAAIKKESQLLLQFLRSARDQALTSGQDLGLELSDDGYRLLTFKKDRWVAVLDQRLLAPVTINPDLRLSVIAGDSVWQESLSFEADNSFTLEDDDDTEREEEGFSDEEKLSPTLYFWSSGTLSPASILISLTNKENRGRMIVMAESGAISFQSGEEENE